MAFITKLLNAVRLIGLTIIGNELLQSLEHPPLTCFGATYWWLGLTIIGN
jgi:hypothetical protein